MPLALSDLVTAPTADEVLSSILAVASSLGLSTTSWQSGSMGRTILQLLSQKIADSLSIVSLIAKGGLLDYAADVTTEGGPGWLDLLAAGFFGETRVAATYATCTMQFTTTAACPGGTYTAGTLHVARGSIGYSNAASITIPLGAGSVTGSFVADVAGSASSSGIGTITTMVTTITGCTATNTTAAVGADSERNAVLVARLRAKWASISVDGPSGAYVYAAKNVNGANMVAVTSGALTTPAAPATRAKAVTSASTGTVTTYVASASGVYATPPNYTNNVAKSIASSTNASPIVITTSAAHGYATGDTVYVSGHLVNTAANGSWTITVTGGTTFSLNSSTGNGVGAATGSAYRYSDLDLIDNSIQANAVPLTATAVTQSATSTNIAVIGTITVTGATAAMADADIVALARTALDTFAGAVPIGGVGTTATVYLEQLRATIWNAIDDPVNVTLSSPAGDTAIAATAIPVMSPAPTFTITRV